MNVFISSTCYDLIDLRAELELFFKEAGVSPILSDSISSDFTTHVDRNSIETCLANVRSCDHFIIILSRRYGPRLGHYGFEDISATHLEYREAKNQKKPIRMYVRDHLDGDFTSWKRNGHSKNFEPTWCEKNDFGLFELLEEHRKLEAEGSNNWLWIFRNSIELKERLRTDFKATFTNATANRLFQAGSLPFLVIEGYVSKRNQLGYFVLKMNVRNVGRSCAIQPSLDFGVGLHQCTIRSLGPAEIEPINNMPLLSDNDHQTIKVEITYSTLEGHKFKDIGLLSFTHDRNDPNLPPLQYAPEEKIYIGSTGVILRS